MVEVVVIEMGRMVTYEWHFWHTLTKALDGQRHQESKSENVSWPFSFQPSLALPDHRSAHGPSGIHLTRRKRELLWGMGLLGIGHLYEVNSRIAQ